ncbi:glycosyltransferase [Campylobacter sp. MIT 21-1685]|uniref:glycosyltransferase n=1 Tax=unclassified Campylobacter TaxID=2593542 RepID=UPI00224ADB38|nr:MULTISPECIES: glycosyltransferase [unclassified Campylobacter]MCX2683204.1 glycosyltransferase [Campylobacter sp. MIT 21-1684]MCX2751476.1 glycosyltransferase [Campylobacter sp. MIT 21-1682]MCX2807685.1 glycosyltransferase [Campylobacter sp. MIT 21-1685]
MRISFIIATLNAGGAERVLVSLANALCKEHQICIIKFHAQDSFYPLEKEITLKTLPQFDFTSLYNKIVSRCKKYYALRKILKQTPSDVFISFLDTTNIACIFATRGLKTPLIISEHSNESYLRSFFWRFLRKRTYPYCSALTVLTNDDKSYYEHFVKKVVLLANPCHFSATISPNSDFEKENLVLFVGRLDSNKNPLMFVKAVAELEKDLQEKYEFCIAGEGILRAELEKNIQNLGISVKLLGQVESIEKFYKKAKILCLCSFIEGLPTVLIESLYFKVCRISSTYHSGAKDLIQDNFDGLLCECGNEKDLAQKLSKLLNDENLRQKLVQNASLRCKDYELPFITKQWLKLIKELQNG